MHKGLRFFGIFTSIGMLIVLLQGAVVTKTDSGDGCGETWPLCFGEFVPSSPVLATMIEYSHRLVSGIVGLLVVILAIWSWRKLSHVRETKFWALMAVLFIIFQGFMGAAAVVFGHSSLVLALHFGISAISLASVVILTILSFEDGRNAPAPKVTRGFRAYVFFVLAYSYAVIYTGAYVKHTGSSFACDAFPHCGTEAMGFQAGVQMFHRITAILLVVFLLILFIRSFRYRYESRLLVVSSGVVFVLILVQAAAGVAILFSDAYLATALVHSLVISMTFTVLCYIAMILTRRPAV